MKFAAAAITPGRAKTCQNGTEPSAKSTQSVPLFGTPQVSAAAARWGAITNAEHAARRMTSSRFTDPDLTVAASLPRLPVRLERRERPFGRPRQRFELRLLVVERRVDLGNFLRLGRLVGLRLVVLS